MDLLFSGHTVSQRWGRSRWGVWMNESSEPSEPEETQKKKEEKAPRERWSAAYSPEMLERIQRLDELRAQGVK